MALQQPTADDLRQAIEEEASVLDSEGAVVVHALANLCVLVSRLEDGMAVPAALTSRTARLQGMLEDRALQENAISLLTALLCLDDAAWEQLVNNGYVPQAVQMLMAAAHGAVGAEAGGVAEPQPAESSALQLNLVASVTEVARRSDEGAQALVAAGGLGPILALCSTRAEPRLAEAAVDALCCLATCEALRPTLTEEGTVQTLGVLLETPHLEIRVRALLALGMLLPGSERNQLDLASTPGVAQHLMASMQQKQDLDCKMIARDVFTTLVQNPLCRDLIEASLRSTAAA